MCGLAVNIRREEGLASIHLTGYLSATASEMLKDLLAEVNGADQVRLVFAKKALVNMAVVRLFAEFLQLLKARGTSCCLEYAAPCVHRVFDAVGLSELLPYCEVGQGIDAETESVGQVFGGVGYLGQYIGSVSRS